MICRKAYAERRLELELKLEDELSKGEPVEVSPFPHSQDKVDSAKPSTAEEQEKPEEEDLSAELLAQLHASLSFIKEKLLLVQEKAKYVLLRIV